MARILHNNRVKFPKDFFSIVLYTNMAAMTSSENHLLVPSSLHPTYLPSTTTCIPSTQVVFFWITVAFKMNSKSRTVAFVLYIFELKSNYNCMAFYVLQC